jgi:hypothetical protein
MPVDGLDGLDGMDHHLESEPFGVQQQGPLCHLAPGNLLRAGKAMRTARFRGFDGLASEDGGAGPALGRRWVGSRPAWGRVLPGVASCLGSRPAPATGGWIGSQGPSWRQRRTEPHGAARSRTEPHVLGDGGPQPLLTSPGS